MSSNRHILALMLLLLCALPMDARRKQGQLRLDPPLLSLEDSLSDEFLDTVSLKSGFVLNDYSMIGLQYGYGLNMTMFNPSKSQGMLRTPLNLGIVYTRYTKMFNFMPYVGYQLGLFAGQDGYVFKKKKDGQYSSYLDAVRTVTTTDEEGNEVTKEERDFFVDCTFDYVEIPFMSHFHYDMNHLKLFVNAGFYGGYRYNIHRTTLPGYNFLHARTDSFYDYESRWDYGIKGGAGLGVVFAPIELHLSAMVRYGFGSLYSPDHSSRYYYRFAYPFDILISAGLHFHLGKRTGRSTKELRQEAYRIVYGEE